MTACSQKTASAPERINYLTFSVVEYLIYTVCMIGKAPLFLVLAGLIMVIIAACLDYL